MNSQNVSNDRAEEEEDISFILKPFNELDNSLFNFTEDLKDPYCQDH